MELSLTGTAANCCLMLCYLLYRCRFVGKWRSQNRCPHVLFQRKLSVWNDVYVRLCALCLVYFLVINVTSKTSITMSTLVKQKKTISVHQPHNQWCGSPGLKDFEFSGFTVIHFISTLHHHWNWFHLRFVAGICPMRLEDTCLIFSNADSDMSCCACMQWCDWILLAMMSVWKRLLCDR